MKMCTVANWGIRRNLSGFRSIQSVYHKCIYWSSLNPLSRLSPRHQRPLPNANLKGELITAPVPRSRQTKRDIVVYQSQDVEHAFVLQDCHSILRNGKTYSGLHKTTFHRTCNIFAVLFQWHCKPTSHLYHRNLFWDSAWRPPPSVYLFSALLVHGYLSRNIPAQIMKTL